MRNPHVNAMGAKLAISLLHTDSAGVVVCIVAGGLADSSAAVAIAVCPLVYCCCCMSDAVSVPGVPV